MDSHAGPDPRRTETNVHNRMCGFVVNRSRSIVKPNHRLQRTMPRQGTMPVRRGRAASTSRGQVASIRGVALADPGVTVGVIDVAKPTGTTGNDIGEPSGGFAP